MVEKRETDEQRIQRAATEHVRMILADRRAIADAAAQRLGLSALDRLTAIMFEQPEGR